MIRYQKLIQNPELFFQITNIPIEDFDRVLVKIKAVKNKRYQEYVPTDDRLALGDRLLLVVTWLNLWPNYDALGKLFRITRSAARSYVKQDYELIESVAPDFLKSINHPPGDGDVKSLKEIRQAHPALDAYLIDSSLTAESMRPEPQLQLAVGTNAPIPLLQEDNDGSGGVASNRNTTISHAMATLNQKIGMRVLDQVATAAFILVVLWAFILAMRLNVSYQDRWILEDLELPMAALVLTYILNLLVSRDLRKDALLSAVMGSLLFVLPAMKYAYIYISTLDASVHFSLMRSLATTGFPEQNYYQFTPGMHILIGSLAQLSGLDVSVWARLLPGLMGGLVPLSFYMLVKRLQFTYLLAKAIVAVSVLSIPLMFIPLGTSYAAVIIMPLLVFLILAVIHHEKSGDRTVFGVVAIILMLALMMWHSISSLLVPLVLAGAGTLAFLFSSFLAKRAWNVGWLQSISKNFMMFGYGGAGLTLLYWFAYADDLWTHLIENLQLLGAVIAFGSPSGGVLIPERTGILNFGELVTVFLFYHARDAILIGLAVIAVISVTLHLKARKQISRPIELTYLFSIIYLVFFLIITATFAVRFATYGYQRILIYILMVSPVLSGFGLWITVKFMRGKLPSLPADLILSVILLAAFVISGLQFYPYQPIAPKYAGSDSGGSTPLLWYHQVNTDYQRYLLDFAYHQIPGDTYLYTDYIKFQQSRLFIGTDARQRFRYGPWGNFQRSYVLMHMPGEAGAYSEQAEHRTPEIIAELRQEERTSVVYDNGEGFILFVPQDMMPQYTFGGNR
jgi:hypothetical protein